MFDNNNRFFHHNYSHRVIQHQQQLPITMDCNKQTARQAASSAGQFLKSKLTACCRRQQQTLFLLMMVSITILSLIHDCHTAGVPLAANNQHHQYNPHILRPQTINNLHRLTHPDPMGSYSGGQLVSTMAPIMIPSSQMQPPPPPAFIGNNNNNNNNPLSNQNLQSNQYLKATHELLLDLRQQMLTRSINFDEHFRNLLSCSKRSLHNMFADTYGLMYEHNTEIFTSMFEGLEQYYANGQIKLTKSMENFFERLYQKIFQVYNSNMVFSSAYLDCATEQLAHLKPFKDVPEKLIDGIRHTFVAARTFVQALNNGIDIIKSIISLGQPTQCTHMINEKLLKNTQTIGNQQTSALRLPCLGFCEGVISRCIGNGNLEPLNEKWKGYVVALSELAMKLSTSYNIETIIAPLDVQISEAIMNFQENGHNITHHVYQACGQPPTVMELQSSTQKPFPGAEHKIGKRATKPGPVIAGASNQNRHNQRTLAAMHQPSLVAVGHWPSSTRDILSIGLPHMPEDLTPIGQKSPLLIDEIKNYMLTTKSFWHNLPNTVCTSNYTLGANASKKQSNCYQERFNISDINSDLRYRNEMHQQISRLDSMRSKIENALAGVEIDWRPEIEQSRSKIPPNINENPNIRFPLTTSTTSTTTTTEPPVDDDDEGDDILEDHGSGDDPEQPNLPGEFDPTYPGIDDPVDTIPPEDDEDLPTTDDSPTYPESSTVSGENIISVNNIDQPSQLNIPEVLITPPNQGAQKSSESSNKLLISNEHHLVFASMVSIALLLLNSFRSNLLFVTNV